MILTIINSTVVLDMLIKDNKRDYSLIANATITDSVIRCLDACNDSEKDKLKQCFLKNDPKRLINLINILTNKYPQVLN